jgi:hypothetical protein
MWCANTIRLRLQHDGIFIAPLPRSNGGDVMAKPIQLLTYSNKYDEQVVAVRMGGSSSHVRLFDATHLFMEDETLHEKIRVKEQAKAFAEQFVEQMNASHISPPTSTGSAV